LGYILKNLGKIDLAIEIFKKAIKYLILLRLIPNEGHCYNNLGFFLLIRKI